MDIVKVNIAVGTGDKILILESSASYYEELGKQLTNKKFDNQGKAIFELLYSNLPGRTFRAFVKSIPKELFSSEQDK